MPYNGVPESMTDTMDRCKEKVMAQGRDESSAIAICHASIVGKSEEAMKTTSEAGFSLTEEELKNLKDFSAKLDSYQVHSFKAESYGGTPREKLKDSDFVFSDERAFPVMTSQDVTDAVHSWGRYRGGKSFEDFKRNLTALAKRKGLESALPEDWKKKPAAKFSVKVAGDWVLEVNGNPFGPDADSQWFDSRTKIVSGSEVPVVYYHSLSEDSVPGYISFEETPEIIGKAYGPELKNDGWWWKVVLDKTAQKAKDVWEAAKNQLAVASSGAIEYLSRLEINGKLIPYDKRKPGRIAIWHMGELSLWDKPGHLSQAHPHAVPVPVFKAIYEAAKMPFPPSLVSSKNAESFSEERKAELEELLKQNDEIERFIVNQIL